MKNKFKVTFGPGYRFFKCEHCGHEWKETSRHCESQSSSIMMCTCDDAMFSENPISFERHYEWEKDKNGNYGPSKEDS